MSQGRVRVLPNCRDQPKLESLTTLSQDEAMNEILENRTNDDDRLQRRSDRRIVSGLSGGIADALGVDVAYIRAAFIVLTLTGGVGVVLYGIGWLATTDRVTDSPSGRIILGSSSETTRAIGLQLVLAGVVVAFSSAGVAVHPSIMWPVSLTLFGFANVWAYGDNRQRQLLQAILPSSDPTSNGSRRDTLIRLTIGGGLVAAGLIMTFTSTAAFRQVGSVALAVTVTTVGLLLVLAPWVLGLLRQLTTERRQRIRSEEKTEIAAHLHDSVLQTLALIQASADPEQQAVLARIQERELRSWLFGDDDEPDATLKVMMEAVGAEIEKAHRTAVDVVTVGDAPADADVAAIVAATREALINAAKHSGRRTVSLFTEVGSKAIEVFVTDQGLGFEPDSVDPDRHGISESIVGRMQRHGGTATITASPDGGTEVHLTLPTKDRT